MKIYDKDYCSFFPDTFAGIYIGDCCKKHDNECGEKGSFNFIEHQTNFFECLNRRLDNKIFSLIITLGGSFFCLLKYPYFIYKKIKYKKGK